MLTRKIINKLIFTVFISSGSFLLITCVNEKSDTSSNGYVLRDSINYFSMVLPNSPSKVVEKSIIANINCVITRYTTTMNQAQIVLTVISLDSLNHTTNSNSDSLAIYVKRVTENICSSIQYPEEAKAGSLKGLRYSSNICGVPTDNFVGTSGNKVFIYVENLVGKNNTGKSWHFNAFSVNREGDNLSYLIKRNF